MPTLILRNGKRFNTDYAGPVNGTGGAVFTTRVLESTVPEVNRTFIDPNLTDELTVMYGDIITGVYTGYTRYAGFYLNDDGSIMVTLQKNLEV